MSGAASRWQQFERLYHEALSRNAGGERDAYVRSACGSDEQLRAELESLLSYDNRAATFLTGPSLDAAASALVDEANPGALSGRELGPYVIGELLGTGGMGDVYRGRDMKLGRDVAIKILPDVYALDERRRSRFTREARVLASLNHPNIGGIYGFEERDGIHALILELVEGETLAQRLTRGALSIEFALQAAEQIAEALEVAHAKGIVHRDLKPANIILQTSSRDSHHPIVKVVDFGLAKSANTEAPSTAATSVGTIFGTAPYMSPEQARGLPVDARTDLWSFGCVLFEMLTAHPAFAGATSADTLAAILEREPDWQLLPPDTPETIAALLRACLQKAVEERISDISDVHTAFHESSSRSSSRRGSRSPWRASRLVAGVIVLIAAVAAMTTLWQTRRPHYVSPTRLSVFVPGILSPQLSATVSPDGDRVAFVSTGATGKLMLWVRALDSLDATVIQGTENAAHPFWSPDGGSLGFLADGKLKRVDLKGGAVRTLADSPDRSGGSWSRGGLILFAARLGQLGTISASGGPVTIVGPRSEEGRGMRWPYFLPDGRHFIFWRTSKRPDERGLYLGSLDSTEARQLVQSEFKGAIESGHLLYMRDDALMAQPFDADRLQLTSAPLRVADAIWTARGAGQASFSVSHDGVLAYVNASVVNLQPALFDRSGRLRGFTGQATRYIGPPQISPDGRQLATVQGTVGAERIWLTNLADQSSARITLGPTPQTDAVWAVDGTRLAYLTATDHGLTVTTKTLREGSEEMLVTSERIVSLEDWSPDGQHFVYAAVGARSYSDLWLLSLKGERKLVPFLESAFNKTQAQISPDGRWIAYTSYESGADEVYVERFPARGDRRQVSVSGGAQPRWRKDGQELFYIAPDQRLMALSIHGGPTLEIGPPVALFKTRVLPHGSQSIGLRTLYDASPDGQRFVCLVPPEDPGAPITVVLNWTAALRQPHVNQP